MPNIASLVQSSNGQTNDWKKKVKNFNLKLFIRILIATSLKADKIYSFK